MRKIVLACAAGASTSMLMLNMRQAAAAQGYECEVHAYPLSDVEEKAADADIVLLGPQVRFQVGKVSTMVSCPVQAVDTMMYGTMDGAGVIAAVKEALGD